VRPTRELLRRAAEAVGTAILLVAGFGFCLSRGRITLLYPETVLSNAHPVMKAQEPFLLYLRDLRRRLPPGATVVVLSPQSAADLPTGPSYLLPLGQLPAQLVVPYTVLFEPSASLPRYVAVFRPGLHEDRYRFHDDRYRLVSSTADDQLWELAAPPARLDRPASSPDGSR
jgi:hypothetical protein